MASRLPLLTPWMLSKKAWGPFGFRSARQKMYEGEPATRRTAHGTRLGKDDDCAADPDDFASLERAVLSRLADDRAAIALAGALKIGRAVAPLWELLTGYPDELRAEAARALLTLTDEPAIRQQAETVLTKS